MQQCTEKCRIIVCVCSCFSLFFMCDTETQCVGFSSITVSWCICAEIKPSQISATRHRQHPPRHYTTTRALIAIPPPIYRIVSSLFTKQSSLTFIRALERERVFSEQVVVSGTIWPPHPEAHSARGWSPDTAFELEILRNIHIVCKHEYNIQRKQISLTHQDCIDQVMVVNTNGEKINRFYKLTDLDSMDMATSYIFFFQ